MDGAIVLNVNVMKIVWCNVQLMFDLMIFMLEIGTCYCIVECISK